MITQHRIAELAVLEYDRAKPEIPQVVFEERRDLAKLVIAGAKLAQIKQMSSVPLKVSIDLENADKISEADIARITAAVRAEIKRQS